MEPFGPEEPIAKATSTAFSAKNEAKRAKQQEQKQKQQQQQTNRQKGYHHRAKVPRQKPEFSEFRNHLTTSRICFRKFFVPPVGILQICWAYLSILVRWHRKDPEGSCQWSTHLQIHNHMHPLFKLTTYSFVFYHNHFPLLACFGFKSALVLVCDSITATDRPIRLPGTVILTKADSSTVR